MRKSFIAVIALAAAVYLGRSFVFRAAGEINARKAERPTTLKRVTLRLRNSGAKSAQKVDADVNEFELVKLYLA